MTKFEETLRNNDIFDHNQQNLFTNNSFVVVKKDESKIALLTKVKSLIFQRLFILQWLPKYTKNDVLADLIAGLTLGLTMMPQSIAYAGLAGLKPQYGLYTAFIGSYTYIFVGTIKEVSIGPTSLMSLLTHSYTAGKPTEYIILLTFVAGCVELLMGVLNLGFLVDFISPCLSSGFASATAVIIVSTQLKGFLGVNIKSHDLIGILKELFEKIHEIRPADTALGFVCIAFLVALKYVNRIKVANPAVKKYLWILSISKNALVVLLATVAAALWDQHSHCPFKITGEVPKGVPSFKLPSPPVAVGNETAIGYVDMLQSLGSGLIVIPLVAVLANVAIAKAYCSDVIVDASQEMISLGLSNIMGSFVRAMPSTGAFTRSAVASSSGVRTPLQGLYSGTLILLALTFLAPYFYYIPKAALAAVLITAVSSLFDYKIFPILWKCNKIDFFITLGTFIIGIFVGVEAGIVAGSLCNLLVLLKLWTRPKILSEIKEKPGKIGHYVYIKPELGLYYAGADYISDCIKKINKENPGLPIVLDCANIIRLDYTAAKTLENLLIKYNATEIGLFMINVNANVLSSFKSVTDTNYLSLCSSSEDIVEIVITDNAGENEEAKALLNGEEGIRKMSIISKMARFASVNQRKHSINSIE
ncbi:unnamed protein product [Phyllotreta striolata]|uniref:Sodium-independent sulfate anion transporter n=1 Tax=Phyllotreta striolata TaxID=444603 RepID=A0A9N9TSW0_PHYSR|nr:unnamed protein product [Phyllotreta striolata]